MGTHFIPEVSNALCSNDYKGSKADKGLGQPLIPEVARTLTHLYDSSPCADRGMDVIAIQDTRGFDKAQNGIGINNDDCAYTIDTLATQGVAVIQGGSNQDQFCHPNGVAPTLCNVSGAHGGHHQPKVIEPGYAVRRLTPLECERLQGFPDDYTLVPYRGKPACDGPRYKALGNSWAVNVASWIGQRIEEVEGG